MSIVSFLFEKCYKVEVVKQGAKLKWRSELATVGPSSPAPIETNILEDFLLKIPEDRLPAARQPSQSKCNNGATYDGTGVIELKDRVLVSIHEGIFPHGGTRMGN